MFANLSLISLLFVLISLLISMTVHEAMHGYAAHWLGDTTAAEMGRLTFNPLKSIDLVTTVALPLIMIILGYPPFFIAKPVPFNPNQVRHDEYGVALVGLAGPLSNLVLAILGAIIFHLFGTLGGSTFYNAIVIFVEINIAFFIFNMIPFPPLDGSRVLYAFAPESLQRIMLQIESAGFMAIIVFFFIIFQFISGPIINIESFMLHLLLG